MRLLHLLLAVLSTFAFAGAAHARSAELVDPAPVAIPAGLDDARIAKDIKRALITRGWAVTAEQPGLIESTLNLREHVARIRISYDKREVRVAYVDSTNLEFREKKGTRYIHPNYLGWIGFLTRDMTANLQLSALDQQ